MGREKHKYLNISVTQKAFYGTIKYFFSNFFKCFVLVQHVNIEDKGCTKLKIIKIIIKLLCIFYNLKFHRCLHKK